MTETPKPLDPLLIADLSHALNSEDDACVAVSEVGYGSFRVFDIKSMKSEDVPGFSVLFEKGGKRYMGQFTLYAGRMLEDS